MPGPRRQNKHLPGYRVRLNNQKTLGEIMRPDDATTRNEHRVTGQGKDRGYGVETCPVCGATVALRKNGLISGHRQGTSQKKSWPCPGGNPS